MFHVLDHAGVVYTGELSQATQYIIEHYGNKLDEAIRSGIKITWTDPLHRFNEETQTMAGNWIPDLRSQGEAWKTG
ncbi:MAG: hypothetical protein NTV11_16610 [Rhodocyclales bacterium]|nr:hypothetical protein [Rhodocyclales bacterium]